MTRSWLWVLGVSAGCSAAAWACSSSDEHAKPLDSVLGAGGAAGGATGGAAGSTAGGKGGAGGDSGQGGTDGGEAGSAGEPGDAAAETGNLTDLANDTMLAELRLETGKCVLFALPPLGKFEQVTSTYKCNRRFRVRRTDGELFYVEEGKVYRYPDPNVAIDTACEPTGPFDFDGLNQFYYRCEGGTTGPLYRDKTLVAENVVPVIGGVFADGRILWDGWENYHVMDGSGAEVTKYDTPFDYTTLEYATTVMESHAFVLFRNSATGSGTFAVMKYSAAGFETVTEFGPSATGQVPSNFGDGHRFDSTGALYASEGYRVVRYEGGASTVVWEDKAEKTEAVQLVHYYKQP